MGLSDLGCKEGATSTTSRSRTNSSISSRSSAALSWTVVVPWPRGEGCQVTKGSQLPPASRVRRVTKDIRHGVGDGDLGQHLIVLTFF